MANEEPKGQPMGRFAEAIRERTEKRAPMQRATQRLPNLEDESRNREDTSIADRAFENHQRLRNLNGLSAPATLRRT